MHNFEDIKPGARLLGLDPAGIAEVVQVARFGPHALNLVFRVDGRVGERLVYRGEESSFDFLETGRSYAQINRQLSGWNLPPLMIRAFGAHCQEPT
jgi:hypothetical protein